MIKFAKLTTEGKVECVVLMDDSYNGNFTLVGAELRGTYVQITDPNGDFVGNATVVPSPGSYYINEHFVDRQPHLSWTLNTSTYEWDPPVAQPNPDDVWIEEYLSWFPFSLDYSTATPTATYVPTTETLASLDVRASSIEADVLSGIATSVGLQTSINALDDRLSAIESNVISGIASSSALLTLIADLESRINTLEGN